MQKVYHEQTINILNKNRNDWSLAHSGPSPAHSLVFHHPCLQNGITIVASSAHKMGVKIK